MLHLLKDTVSLKTSLNRRRKLLEINSKLQRLNDFTVMKVSAELKSKSWSAPCTLAQRPMQFCSLQQPLTPSERWLRSWRVNSCSKAVTKRVLLQMSSTSCRRTNPSNSSWPKPCMNMNLFFCWFVDELENWKNTSVGSSGSSPLFVPTLNTVSKNNVEGASCGPREKAALRKRLLQGLCSFPSETRNNSI